MGWHVRETARGGQGRETVCLPAAGARVSGRRRAGAARGAGHPGPRGRAEGVGPTGPVGGLVRPARPAAGRHPPPRRAAAAGAPLPAPAGPGRPDRRGGPDARTGHADPRGGDRRTGGQPAVRAGAAVRHRGLGFVGGDGRIVFRPSGIAQRRPARPGAGGAGPGGRAGPRRARPGGRVSLLGGPVAAAPGHDRGPVHRRLHRLRAGRQGVGGRPHHRSAGQDHAGVHPRRGRGLLPAASGGVQRGAVLHRHARAHP